jgi:hypothetical protein
MCERRYQISGSAALRTNEIWSKTIGHDPYAAAKTQGSEIINANAAEQAANYMLLAKMSNAGSETRGGCKRCGGVGHLTFQCRNPIADTLSSSAKKEDIDSETSSSSDSDSYADNVRQVSAEATARAADQYKKDGSTVKVKAHKSGSKPADYKERKEHKKSKKEKKDKKEKKEKKEKKKEKKEKKEKKARA